MTAAQVTIGLSYRPAAYLTATLAWTWGFWLPISARALDPWQGTGQVLLYAGGVGPLVIALWFQARHSGGRGLSDLWRRLVEPSRASLGLWVFMLALVPLLSLAALIMSGAVGESVIVLSLPAETATATLAYVGFIFLLGPLPEEIGWRGYGLDALLSRTGPLAASVVLGAVWGAWHLPLFLIDGYYTPFGGPPALAPFLWSILMNTVIMTWAYLKSDRSLLLMVVFHFMINFTGEVLPLDTSAELGFLVLQTAVAIVAVMDFRHRFGNQH